MMPKTAQVRELLAFREYQEALKIGKSFTRGLSKDDMAAIRLAYEVMLYPKFYQQMGVDVVVATTRGIEILTEKTALKEKSE